MDLDDTTDGPLSERGPFASPEAIVRLSQRPDETTGIRQPSRLMVDKITTVSRSKLGERIGRLSDDDIAGFARSVVVFLGLATP